MFQRMLPGCSTTDSTIIPSSARVDLGRQYTENQKRENLGERLNGSPCTQVLDFCVKNMMNLNQHFENVSPTLLRDCIKLDCCFTLVSNHRYLCSWPSLRAGPSGPGCGPRSRPRTCPRWTTQRTPRPDLWAWWSRDDVCWHQIFSSYFRATFEEYSINIQAQRVNPLAIS